MNILEAIRQRLLKFLKIDRVPYDPPSEFGSSAIFNYFLTEPELMEDIVKFGSSAIFNYFLT